MSRCVGEWHPTCWQATYARHLFSRSLLNCLTKNSYLAESYAEDGECSTGEDGATNKYRDITTNERRIAQAATRFFASTGAPDSFPTNISAIAPVGEFWMARKTLSSPVRSVVYIAPGCTAPKPCLSICDCPLSKLAEEATLRGRPQHLTAETRRTLSMARMFNAGELVHLHIVMSKRNVPCKDVCTSESAAPALHSLPRPFASMP